MNRENELTSSQVSLTDSYVAFTHMPGAIHEHLQSLKTWCPITFGMDIAGLDLAVKLKDGKL